MVRVTKTGGCVVCVEPAQGFACGVRLMEFRPSTGDHLEHDRFWSIVRYAYLKGFTLLTGEDLHIGARCVPMLESAGLVQVWSKSFYHIIRGSDHAGTTDDLHQLEKLLDSVEETWYPKPFKEILEAGGLSDEHTSFAVDTNKKNRDAARKAIADLQQDRNRQPSLDILSRMLIMVPQIVVGGIKPESRK